MSNHPITMMSPAQVIQSSLAANNDRFAASNSSSLPTSGSGTSSTGDSSTSAASVTITPGTVAPDNYALQSNDSTAFVFGSTASGQATAGNQYTTVNDTAKSATQAATTEEQMIGTVGQRGPRKAPLKPKKQKSNSTILENNEDIESAPIRPYSLDAKKTVARAIEKGIIMM